MEIGGKTMIARVCQAIRDSQVADKVIVAWAHKFSQFLEEDVLSRFRFLVIKYQPDTVIRLTSDCPLLNGNDIIQAFIKFNDSKIDYYSNHRDGHDVQIFKPEILWTKGMYHQEHVIADFTTKSTGLSVNTLEDLERVRKICEMK